MMSWLKPFFVWAWVLIVAGSAVLYSAAPLNTKEGAWAHVVLRNWEEYGWRNLGAKMVLNPAGSGIQEKRDLYTGHRPFILYFGYAVGHLTGRAGENGLPFYLLLTLLLGAAIWGLLGADDFALMTACAFALAPGYLRTTLTLDTLGIPVLLGFPVMLLAIRILQADKITLRTGLVLFALVALYGALNWTTAFAFAVTFAYLVVAMRARPQRWILFTLIAGVAAVIVGAISVLDKQGGRTGGSSSSWAYFYNNYLIGPGGYHGYPMNWSRAIIRITAANLVGLLPLILLYAWGQYQGFRTRGRPSWLSVLPLAMAISTVAGMRNYFAHHPWMAAPVLIFGLIFSMRLLRVCAAGEPPAEPARSARPGALLKGAFCMACLVYGLLVVLVLRLNSAEDDALMRLVWLHTSRHEILAYVPEQDPLLSQDVERLESLLDRKMIPLSELKNVAVPQTASLKRYLLTASQKEQAGRPVAQGKRDDFLGSKSASSLLEWYRTHIARRAKGDRLETASTYYLYQLP
jgi:hypothetical protein